MRGDDQKRPTPDPTAARFSQLNWRARLQSFRHALAGLTWIFATQPNAWIHAVASVIVVALGLGFGLSAGEWLALILTIALVWFAEAMNTAFEHLCDVVQPEFHESVKRSKDIAAAAVLIAAAAAMLVGLIVFLPRLLGLLGG